MTEAPAFGMKDKERLEFLKRVMSILDINAPPKTATMSPKVAVGSSKSAEAGKKPEGKQTEPAKPKAKASKAKASKSKASKAKGAAKPKPAEPAKPKAKASKSKASKAKGAAKPKPAEPAKPKAKAPKAKASKAKAPKAKGAAKPKPAEPAKPKAKASKSKASKAKGAAKPKPAEPAKPKAKASAEPAGSETRAVKKPAPLIRAVAKKDVPIKFGKTAGRQKKKPRVAPKLQEPKKIPVKKPAPKKTTIKSTAKKPKKTSMIKSARTPKRRKKIKTPNTLEDELAIQLTPAEIDRFRIEKVDMERLTHKVCDILLERESEGMLQDDLYENLKLSARDGARLSLKLERMGMVNRVKLLVGERWTYKITLKKTPVSTVSLADAPCLVCPVEQKCSLDGDISPRTCKMIEEWVMVDLKRAS